MRPLFPAPNPVQVNFEILGKLPLGDDESCRVDAATQSFHGCSALHSLQSGSSGVGSKTIAKGAFGTSCRRIFR